MRGVASYSEDLDQVVELPMDVSDYGHGCRDVDHVALAHEELFCLFADLFEEGLAEELLAQEGGDACIKIEGHCSERVWVTMLWEKRNKNAEEVGSLDSPGIDEVGGVGGKWRPGLSRARKQD